MREAVGLGLRFEAVVIGGAALNLLGVVDCVTRDCDVLEPTVPREIAEAARRFAATEAAAGNALQQDWLNNGPETLARSLPLGSHDRLTTILDGKAITLRCLGRPDLLKSKPFALCDRAIDLPDCVALTPTTEELADALPWVLRQDTNPEWPDHVRETFEDVGWRLGHGTLAEPSMPTTVRHLEGFKLS